MKFIVRTRIISEAEYEVYADNAHVVDEMFAAGDTRKWKEVVLVDSDIPHDVEKIISIRPA